MKYMLFYLEQANVIALNVGIATEVCRTGRGMMCHGKSMLNGFQSKSFSNGFQSVYKFLLLV